MSWGSAAGNRIVRSRAEININIVDIAHDVLVIAKCGHHLVFAAAEILPAANDNPVKFGVVYCFQRILESRRITRTFTIGTVADRALGCVAAVTGIAVPIHHSIRLHIEGRVSLCIEIFAFVVLLDRLGVSWDLGHCRGSAGE